MSGDSSKSTVRALIDERRAAEKEIERLRLDAHAIACAMTDAAKILASEPERLCVAGLTPDPRFDEQGATSDIAGVDRIASTVRELRLAIRREDEARQQLRGFGVDFQAIEDELLAQKSRALHRPSPVPTDDKPRKRIGFDLAK